MRPPSGCLAAWLAGFLPGWLGQVVGKLIAHAGSGYAAEVGSALEALVALVDPAPPPALAAAPSSSVLAPCDAVAASAAAAAAAAAAVAAGSASFCPTPIGAPQRSFARALRPFVGFLRWVAG